MKTIVLTQHGTEATILVNVTYLVSAYQDTQAFGTKLVFSASQQMTPWRALHVKESPVQIQRLIDGD